MGDLDPWSAPASQWMPTNPISAGLRNAWLQSQMLQALTRGDAAAAAGYLTDDATYWISDGIGQCSATPCSGRAAVLAELERQAAVHAAFLPFGLATSGNTVTGRYAVRSDRTTAAGAQRILGTAATEVRGDRISSVRVQLVREDPQTMTFINWVASQAPSPTASPTPAGMVTPAAAPTPAAGATPAAAPTPAAGATPAPATAPTAPPAPAGAPGATASAAIAPQLNSGVTGQATLAQTGETTTVTVTLSGMPPNSAHAGHIHRGSCSGAVIFPLSTIRADASGQGSATSTVNAPIDAAAWWVQYHTSESPPGPPIACGQVMAAP